MHTDAALAWLDRALQAERSDQAGKRAHARWWRSVGRDRARFGGNVAQAHNAAALLDESAAAIDAAIAELQATILEISAQAA